MPTATSALSFRLLQVLPTPLSGSNPRADSLSKPVFPFPRAPVNILSLKFLEITKKSGSIRISHKEFSMRRQATDERQQSYPAGSRQNLTAKPNSFTR